MLFLSIEIRNTGEMASIVDSWRIVVSPPSRGSDLEARLMHFPEITQTMIDGEKRRLTASDAIYERVATMPIPNRGKARGWIAASIDFTRAELATPGMKVVIGFRDVLGQESHAEHVLSGRPNQPKYYPGIHVDRL